MLKNHCVNLLRKTKKNYFTNLNIKDVIDSKTFWKTIKLNLNEKGSSFSKIILSEKGSILNDNKKTCDTTNNFFINITKTLNLKPYKCSNTMCRSCAEISQDEVKKEALHLNLKGHQQVALFQKQY